MAIEQGDLLGISYERVSSNSTEDVILTVDNCESYGYLPKKITLNGQEYTVFYRQGDNETNIAYYEIIDGIAITTITAYETITYSHVAPACSSFKISYADVDKEGSGRNATTGEMQRERVGSYIKIDMAWDLIPNTDEYNNWYKILTHLPPSFKATYLDPSGDMITKKFYRQDISTELYIFVKNRQMWKGLSTSFTQWELDEFDDSFEPPLYQIEENKKYDGVFVNITKNDVIKRVYDYQVEDYIKNGWVKVV